MTALVGCLVVLGNDPAWSAPRRVPWDNPGDSTG